LFFQDLISDEYTELFHTKKEEIDLLENYLEKKQINISSKLSNRDCLIL
jgi:hypothetical protein